MFAQILEFEFYRISIKMNVFSVYYYNIYWCQAPSFDIILLWKMFNSLRLVPILWFLSSLVNCQDFCQSYAANNYKAVMFSPDKLNLFVVIDDKFWIINERDSRLSLRGQTRQAVNSSKLLGNRISTLFLIETNDNELKDFIGYYDVSC